MNGSIRTLRVLLPHLGADAPLPEEDVRLIARRKHFHGARVITYLRLAGRLVPDRHSDAALARARHLADTAPAPFRGLLNRWIDVLCGTASRPSRPLAPSTICSYLRLATPPLRTWHEDGVTDLRAITRTHIEQALEPVQGEAAKSRATALRSLFRALEWECEALGHSDLGRCGSGAWPDSPAVPVLGQRIRLSVGTNCALQSHACGLGE
jgi:hypothetical protein